MREGSHSFKLQVSEWVDGKQHCQMERRDLINFNKSIVFPYAQVFFSFCFFFLFLFCFALFCFPFFLFFWSSASQDGKKDVHVCKFFIKKEIFFCFHKAKNGLQQCLNLSRSSEISMSCPRLPYFSSCLVCLQ